MPEASIADLGDLNERTGNDLELFTAKIVGEAAAAGNQLASTA